jgi:hypothetical protein
MAGTRTRPVDQYLQLLRKCPTGVSKCLLYFHEPGRRCSLALTLSLSVSLDRHADGGCLEIALKTQRGVFQLTPARVLDDMLIGLGSAATTKPPVSIVIELDTCVDAHLEEELIERAICQFGLNVRQEREEDEPSSASDSLAFGSPGTPRKLSSSENTTDYGDTPVKPVS